MITKLISYRKIEMIASELEQHASVMEFLRKIRPHPWERVSPEDYRSLFRIDDAVRIAREMEKSKKE